MLCSQVDVPPDNRHSLSSAGSLDATFSQKWLLESRLSKVTSHSDHHDGTPPENQSAALAASNQPVTDDEQKSGKASMTGVEGGAAHPPAVDAALAEGPACAAEQLSDDGRPQGEAAAKPGGGQLTGLLRYRAPIDPQQRGKLESFDRKIGRAANALHVSTTRPISWMIHHRPNCLWTLL
jgi:hypothetical protein